MAATRTVSPGDLLTRVAGEGRTGAVVVGGHPGGAVYVFEGRVIYAESPAAPGVGELLTASGRLAGRTWQGALDLGGSTAQVGRLLVEQGHLTRGELELCVLGATYDAAYFVLTAAGGPAEFRSGATHWMGPVVHIDAAAVRREVHRRIRLLDEILPNPSIDTAAVIPVTRPPRERITLTAPQWELLVHADGQRTPADLALLLGRAGYTTLQELRRLAALGLIEVPAPRPADTAEFVRLPAKGGVSVPLPRPASDAGDLPTVPMTSGPGPMTRHEPAATDPPPSDPIAADPIAAAEEPGPVLRPPRLARRRPGAKLPRDVAAAESPPVHQGTDEVLLKRIRTALRALR